MKTILLYLAALQSVWSRYEDQIDELFMNYDKMVPPSVQYHQEGAPPFEIDYLFQLESIERITERQMQIGFMILEDIKYKDERLNYAKFLKNPKELKQYHIENWVDVTTFPHRIWTPRIFYDNLVSMKKMGQAQI